MSTVRQHQRGIIAWFAGNPVAANLLMLTIITLGLMSFDGLRKEAFPTREADTVTVSMSYNSGDAFLSEQGITLKIEEALASVSGIKRVTSVSNASGARVSIEGQSGYDLDTLLRDVKAKVDAIYAFPSEAENAVIAKQQRLNHAYSVKIYGDSDRQTLQNLAQRLKVELLANSQISSVTISGEAEPMISIEINEAKLKAYGLSLSDISTVINNESGTALQSSLRNADKVIRLKAAEQAYYQGDFAQIPLKTTSNGGVVRLGDVADVSDTFADDSFVLSRYNGQPGIGLEIKVDEQGDVIKIVEQAEQIVEKFKSKAIVPQAVSVETWYDGSVLIKDRLSLLMKNALSGIALVFIVLALFLNLRVALWVTAGLPFIFCGTLYFMTGTWTDMSINEMTTFGFILALGIVVDDAVVVGESIYSTRRSEGDTLASTVRGAQRVAVPTIFGVLTTVATFIALSNVSGGMGRVYAQFAVIVTICLLLSVVESKLVLPAHLAHLDTHKKPTSGWRGLWAKVQAAADSSLQWFNNKVYRPVIALALEFRYGVVLLFIAIFIIVTGMPQTGAVRVAFFPEIPGSVVQGSLTMQNDASYGQTRENLLRLEQTAIEIDQELSGSNELGIGTIEVIASDDLTGSLVVELNADASYSLRDFANLWRQRTETMAGVKKLDIKARFGGGDNFKVELKAWDTSTIKQAGVEFKQALQQINGVSGIDDNFDSGQSRLKFELTEAGQAMGMNTALLSRQLLQAFGGEIVQRYQRGKDEVKVRVRYPESARQTVADVMQARVRTPDGDSVPLSLVASVSSEFQQNEITRIGGLPAVYVAASVDKDIISSNELVQQLQAGLVPELLAKYPDLSIHFAGEAEQQAETTNSMTQLFILAMLAIYILLAIPLRSYVQPLIIMTAIPFGLVGAILGHWMNDMILSILSFNGIVALSGVVVNDSLLLVSRFNDLKKQGLAISAAITEACTGRLRAVLLTSITTYAGLMPLLSETSAQAQFIIPAAASLGYGILFATVITLILVPSLLLIHHDAEQFLTRLLSAKSQPKEQIQC
ncbi:AcrB/AcrD/AcrF family protein [Thalassotalea euphylliae]|uniref:AcrB/AcrD/AcrF family protein n=1 Tax=Thalassotalea euphylliae TaxID=1655234 RepID=A0A3E0TUG0_9GAMM|nr:efflux RND transporter permease subunit [Thalassotalea euphylliae]REL28208.1 AcrB/AcrD/AcrF family protein [Thalassotalea euphylliae]